MKLNSLTLRNPLTSLSKDKPLTDLSKENPWELPLLKGAHHTRRDWIVEYEQHSSLETATVMLSRGHRSVYSRSRDVFTVI